MRQLWLLPLLVLGIFQGTVSHAQKKIPPPPQYYVLDEPHVLTPETERALQTLLVEHAHLTTEQVLIAVFNSIEDDDPVAYTNRVFSAWGIGKKGRDNGVLLALFWKEHKSRIEVGYGLEPQLTDAKSQEILSDFLAPELRNDRPDRGLSLAALQILTVLESPLIQSGKAQEILKSGGIQGSLQPSHPQPGQNGMSWSVFVVLGFFFALFVLRSILSAEAHYTGRGWFHPSHLRRRGFFWGGGFGGGFGGGGDGGFGGFGGGGGGFSGGGGSSGGGGASGSW